MEDVLNKKTHNPSALPTSAAHATLPTQEGQHAPCTTFLSLFRGGGDFDKSTIIFYSCPVFPAQKGATA